VPSGEGKGGKEREEKGGRKQRFVDVKKFSLAKSLFTFNDGKEITRGKEEGGGGKEERRKRGRRYALIGSSILKITVWDFKAKEGRGRGGRRRRERGGKEKAKKGHMAFTSNSRSMFERWYKSFAVGEARGKKRRGGEEGRGDWWDPQTGFSPFTCMWHGAENGYQGKKGKKEEKGKKHRQERLAQNTFLHNRTGQALWGTTAKGKRGKEEKQDPVCADRKCSPCIEFRLIPLKTVGKGKGEKGVGRTSVRDAQPDAKAIQSLEMFFGCRKEERWFGKERGEKGILILLYLII